MTRELKVALVVGFALVLVVAMLIADHLRMSRDTELGLAVAEQPQMTPGPIELPPESEYVIDQNPLVDPTTGQPVEPRQPAMRVASGENAGASGPVSVPPVTLSMGENNGAGNAALPATPSNLALNAGSPTAGQPNPVSDTTLASNTGETSDLEALRREFARNGFEIRGDSIVPVQNPGVLTTTTQVPTQTGTVPQGASPQLNSVPNTGRPAVIEPAAPASTTYTVVNGDSAYKIAKKFYGDGKHWKRLLEANPKKMSANGEVRVGVTLTIPGVAGSNTTPSGQPQTSKETRVATKPADTASKTAKSEPKPAAKTGKTRTYTIKKGDTLGTIAQRELGSKSRAQDILDLNKGVIKNPDSVPLGVTIKLPAA